MVLQLLVLQQFLAPVQSAHTPGLVALTSLAIDEYMAGWFNVHAKGVPTHRVAKQIQTDSTFNGERGPLLPPPTCGLDLTTD